jgi:uncharacterized Zn finger protein
MRFGYECPECGGYMSNTMKLVAPLVQEAKCQDCGAIYRRPHKTEGGHALPPDFKKVK